MAALWISSVTVTDEDSYAKYAKLAGPAITSNGGVFIARGAKYETLEGTDRPRHVVVRFESLEAARACYHSKAYQEAVAFAHGASERDLVIVEITE
jgi:uncharacterized protein (DUF1330 family)